MALPYYVSPEQMMQDKAEYAKKGIAKGRSIIVLEYSDGVLLAADNPSASLHKISEVYDNIAFAGAGKYSEFENLRKAGIRHADLTGYMYSREDVSARSLSNAYSQSLGTAFGQEVKPLEVELLVVQVGNNDHPNEIYRISFDGSITDEKAFAVIGGRSEARSGISQGTIQHATPGFEGGLVPLSRRIGASRQSETPLRKSRGGGTGSDPHRPKIPPPFHRRYPSAHRILTPLRPRIRSQNVPSFQALVLKTGRPRCILKLSSHDRE